MLNFNKTAQDVITDQKTSSRTAQFTDFWSKKKLEEANVLTDEQMKFFKDLKRTFAFSLHASKKYMVVTLYRKGEKGSDFLVVDMETLKCADASSVKTAKEGVMELINSITPDTTVPDTETAETTEAPAEPETSSEEVVNEVTDAPEIKKSRSHKSRK